MNKKIKLDTEIFCKDDFSDDKGTRKLRKFLHTMIENFHDEMFAFYDIWGEFPFIYSEKQLNSILAPAIHKYTGNVWFEQPFKKKVKKETKQRFLDIVVSDDNNIYLIELKHSWMHINRDETTQETDTKWEKCIEQVRDLKKDNMEEYFYTTENNIFKIALMIMPTWDKKPDNPYIKNEQTAKEYCEMIDKDYRDGYDDQKYKTNFIGVVKINNPQDYKHEDDITVYPYISFVIKACPLESQ